MSVRWLSLAACSVARRSCRSTLFHPPHSSAEEVEFRPQFTHSEISHKRHNASSTKSARKAEKTFVLFVGEALCLLWPNFGTIAACLKHSEWSNVVVWWR